MYSKTHYKIDFDKVNTIEDIKRILKVLNIAIEPNSRILKEIADLVRLEPKQTNENRIPLST
jgi:hypothetical protein